MRITRLVALLSLVALVLVPAAWALRFTDASYNPPVGETGKPYSFKFDGAAGCGPALPYQYRVLNGAPPPGLTLAKDGTLSGVPTTAGSYSFWVELSDEDPPSASWCTPSKAERQFTVQIVQGLKIQQNSLDKKAVYLNQPYSFKFTSNGSSTATFTSTPLPAGLTLASDGTLSGTPTTAGDYTFKVTVHDGDRTDTQTYTLAVVEALKITQATVPAAEVGVDFSLTPSMSGGRAPHTWSVDASTPLPAGLTLDAATGAISGQPTDAGTFPVKLVVTDSFGNTDSVTATIKVAAPLAITHATLRTAKVGKRYSARITTTGGVAPRHFVVLGGNPGFLPAGIRFNVKTGVLSGIAKKAGTFRLRIQAVDKLGIKSSAGFVLKVKA